MAIADRLKGAAGTFEQWLAMPEFDRAVIVSEVQRRIRVHNSFFED